MWDRLNPSCATGFLCNLAICPSWAKQSQVASFTSLPINRVIWSLFWVFRKDTTNQPLTQTPVLPPLQPQCPHFHHRLRSVCQNVSGELLGSMSSWNDSLTGSFWCSFLRGVPAPACLAHGLQSLRAHRPLRHQAGLQQPSACWFLYSTHLAGASLFSPSALSWLEPAVTSRVGPDQLPHGWCCHPRTEIWSLLAAAAPRSLSSSAAAGLGETRGAGATLRSGVEPLGAERELQPPRMAEVPTPGTGTHSGRLLCAPAPCAPPRQRPEVLCDGGAPAPPRRVETDVVAFLRGCVSVECTPSTGLWAFTFQILATGSTDEVVPTEQQIHRGPHPGGPAAGGTRLWEPNTSQHSRPPLPRALRRNRGSPGPPVLVCGSRYLMGVLHEIGTHKVPKSVGPAG